MYISIVTLLLPQSSVRTLQIHIQQLVTLCMYVMLLFMLLLHVHSCCMKKQWPMYHFQGSVQRYLAKFRLH